MNGAEVKFVSDLGKRNYNAIKGHGRSHDFLAGSLNGSGCYLWKTVWTPGIQF